MLNKWREGETSPGRTVVWTEPIKNCRKYLSKVSVVYYLSSSNGQLQHPHFMEVPLSTPDALYLHDVINRLNFLRGKGVASMYSWSCKRSYRSGYVWHDLAETDFIYPAQGQEYVLKGTELPESALIPESDEAVESSATKVFPLPKIVEHGEKVDISAIGRQRHPSFDHIHEYKVYKTECTGEALGKSVANASTQTDDKRRRRRAVRVVKKEEEQQQQREGKCEEINVNNEESQENISISELSKDEIPPPIADSSPETLQNLMKADRKLMLRLEANNENHSSGMSKASSVFMQFLSCGATSFNDHGLALLSQYKARLPRVVQLNQVDKAVKNATVQSTHHKAI